MAQAAVQHGVNPDKLSFKGTIQLLSAFTEKIAHAVGSKRSSLLEVMLRSIAYHRIGNRPGRSEPRAVKRRPKAYPRLTAPRNEARLAL